MNDTATLRVPTDSADANGARQETTRTATAPQPSALLQHCCLSATVKHTAVSNIAPVGDVLQFMRKASPLAERILGIRMMKTKDEQDIEKRKLPAIYFSAVFRVRDANVSLDQRIISKSGLLCLDFDNLAPIGDAAVAAAKRDELARDPYTVAAFVSPRGVGLKVLVQISDPDRFEECWNSAAKHYMERYSLACDEACKDITRACYASHDANLYIAESETLIFEPSALPHSPPPTPAPTATTAGAKIPEGKRNMTLHHVAAHWRRCSMEPGEIEAALLVKNQQECQPPLGEEEVRAIAKSVSQYEVKFSPAPSTWPELRDLDEAAEPPLLDLDAAVSLPWLRTFIREVATHLQVPVETVAPMVLSLISLGTSRAIEVEPRPGWRETGPIWSAVLAEPGERKSAVVSILSRPIYTWQAEERQRMQVALALYAERRRQKEAQLLSLRSTAARIPKAGGQPNAGYAQQALQLAQDLAAMPDLAVPDLITSDATPEAARELLARNGEKLGIIAAEGDVLDVLLGRYNDGAANLGLFLSGYSGDPAPSHRVGRGAHLDRPAIVMCLCVQPQAVSALRASPEAAGRGFLPRMFFVRPKSKLGNRDQDPPCVSDASSQLWAQSLRRLLDLPWPGRVVIEPTGPTRYAGGPRIMTLSTGALALLRRFVDQNEPLLLPASDLAPELRAMVSKLPGGIARIAMALQAVEDPNAKEVAADHMRAACAWAPFLQAHYTSVVCGPAGQAGVVAAKLWSWIEKGGRTEWTTAQAHRQIRNSTTIKKKEDLEPALDLLVEYGRIRRVNAPSGRDGGRPKELWETRPEALKGA